MMIFKPVVGRKRRWPKVVLILAIILALMGVGAFVTVRRIYNQNLQPVNSVSAEEIVVAIAVGSSLDEIASTLEEKGVIRADWAFKQYVRSQEKTDLLQAGTYRFNTSQDVASVVEYMISGRVAVDLFTILPGQRLDQIRAAFIEGGYAAADVDAALDPKQYAGHPALTDKPASASLEGYLYPDSYQRTADTLAQTIIGASLAEMAEVLSPDIRAGIAKQGLSVHEGVIIASIIEKEIPSPPVSPQSDRDKAAQVFLKRHRIGMQLGSDVTAFYGAAIAGAELSVGYDSPYNTRIYSGMPPGPISNVSQSSLEAVAAPATTDFLYFVAGDDGITYFSNTLAEHESLTAQHCKELCGR